MNQILAVSRNNGNKQKIEITKIVKIFAIAMIVFAVIIIGIVCNSIYKSKKQAKENARIPEVNMTQEDKKVRVTIKSEKTIDRVLYKWNDGEENTLYGMGNKEMNELIDLKEGTNTLNVKVIDSEGKEVTFNKEFVVEGIDLEGPEIQMILEGTEIKISVKDDDEISSLKYSINDEQEIEVPITSEDKKQIETRFAITKGESKIKIIAKDKNDNESVKEQTFKGANKPKIDVSKNGGELIVSVTDDEGLKNLECILNEQTFKKDIEGKQIEFSCPLTAGVNIVKLKVTNVNGLTADVDASCEYNP